MPSLPKAVEPSPSLVGEPTPTERFTRTLVELTRNVWRPDCTFESATGAICEAAANALQVERVSVWSYDAQAGELRCLHAYRADTGEHQPPELLETLSLRGDDYVAMLKEVRTFDAAEMQDSAAAEDSHRALHQYLRRHGIRAVLDAPAFVGGDLRGVICHETTLGPRIWSREEKTFAASMGDYVGMAFEVARRRRAEAEVEHLRLHDSVTGLPNRDYMIELIRQRLDVSGRGDEVATVVNVYVDSAGGHAWSQGGPSEDEVMSRVGHRLRSFNGGGVELARTRVDGFTFLITANPAKRTVVRLSEGVLTALRSMDWRPAEAAPSACIGIALADHGRLHDARVLLQQGEEAAEQASLGGAFSYAIYDHEHHISLVEELRQERTLLAAFENGQFELHYQPEYDASTGHWVAAESLLRWRNGDRLVAAGEFIEVLESSDVILSVGRWVLQQACRDAVAWPPTAEGQPVAVRVNVSARQFDEPGLVEDVDAALKASGLDPALLCLELTETTLMRDIDQALEKLRYLRELGVQLAIDDFGVGYASLVYLKRLPINVLKIDRSFVKGIPEDSADMAIVEAIVQLAAAFRIDVVAEGVESRSQQDALRAIGVHRLQGWLYSKAIDNTTLTRMLAAAGATQGGG